MRFWLLVGLSLFSGFCLSIYLHWRLGWDGFFLNLATEIVGILITVLIVERLMERRESAQWRETDLQIRKRTQVFINATVSEVRTSLGISVDVLGRRNYLHHDTEAMHREVIRVAVHVLEPLIEARVSRLDAESWKRLHNALQRINAAADHLLVRFTHRLSPQQQKLLLALQDEAFGGTTLYLTFPECAGAIGQAFPEEVAAYPDAGLRRAIAEQTTVALRKVLVLAVELSGTIQPSSIRKPTAP